MRLPIALLTLLVAVPVLAAPVITWVSDPVRPDETVVLLTEGCSANTVVEIGRASDGGAGKLLPGTSAPLQWTAIKPLQASRQCVKAVIPAKLTLAVFALRLRE
ncbi:MAG: hypothetical protein WCP21_16225, partial [Armatimonadota bacterium]